MLALGDVETAIGRSDGDIDRLLGFGNHDRVALAIVVRDAAGRQFVAGTAQPESSAAAATATRRQQRFRKRGIDAAGGVVCL